MITRLVLSNYRSLGPGAEVRLGPTTVFVGRNGSGKSNIIDSVRFFADCATLGLEAALRRRGGLGALRRWSGGWGLPLRVEVHLQADGRAGAYGFELSGGPGADYRVKEEFARVHGEVDFVVREGRWSGPSDLRPTPDPTQLALPLVLGDSRFAWLRAQLADNQVYSLVPGLLREPQRPQPRAPLHAHGDNWASLLRDQAPGAWKPQLVAALGALTGSIDDVEVRAVGGFLAVRFRHGHAGRRPRWFDAAQESDGTLRVAGILTALLQEPAPPVIGVEEPEQTVHPGAIPLLWDHLRQAALRSQILITTHSPELLDCAGADAVRVVEHEHGVTTPRELPEPQRARVRRAVTGGHPALQHLAAHPGRPTVYPPAPGT